MSEEGRAKQADAQRARSRMNRNVARERGLVINAAERLGATWIADLGDPNPHTIVRVAVPFAYTMSKNHIWSLGASGHVFARRESSNAREYLAWQIKIGIGARKLYIGKLWVDIFVQKPNHSGDAVNVLDLVSDAIQDATGIDDRWYAVRRLNWQIVKEDPWLFVGIAQEITEDYRICSYCGRELPVRMFYQDRRECWECKGQLEKVPEDLRGNLGLLKGDRE